MYLDRYKVQALPQLSLVLWILSPSLVVNELVFGQRVFSRVLIDQKSDGPWVARTHVECTACGTIHPATAWRGVAFGNWFGLLCPKCEAKVPTLLNVFSFVLLIPTAPLWFPLKLMFEKSLHRRQLARLHANALQAPPPPGVSKRSAMRLAAIWAGAMFAFFSLLLMFVRAYAPRWTTGPVGVFHFAVIALMCAAGGLVFGLFTYFNLNRRARRV